MIAHVLLYEARGFAGRLIRWQTRSRYSHAAIEVGGRVWESLQGQGVIAHEPNTEDMSAEWYAVEVPDDKIPMLCMWLEMQVGKAYDWTMVARFVTRRQESRATTGKWFCSELVFAALTHAGVLLFHQTEPWEVPPGWLPRSPLTVRTIPGGARL